MAIKLTACSRCVVWEACAPVQAFASEIPDPDVVKVGRRRTISGQVRCGKCGEELDDHEQPIPRAAAALVALLVQECSMRVAEVRSRYRTIVLADPGGAFAALLTWSRGVCERSAKVRHIRDPIPTPHPYIDYVISVLKERGAIAVPSLTQNEYVLSLYAQVNGNPEDSGADQQEATQYTAEVMLTHKLDAETRARLKDAGL